MPTIINESVETVAADALVPHPENPRRGDLGVIRESIRINGFYGALVAQRSTGHIVVGNHRYQAGVAEGLAEFPVIWVDVDDAEARRILLVDNRANDSAGYDVSALLSLLQGMAEADDLAGTGYDEKAIDALLGELARQGKQGEAPTPLAERFLVPPFSVLDARQGYWKERKASWLELGIRSELGRPGDAPTKSGGKNSGVYLGKRNGKMAPAGEHEINSQPGGLLGMSAQSIDPAYYSKKRDVEALLGHSLTNEEFIERYYEGNDDEEWRGTSIFDPVLCELAYRWFCPPAGRIIDPFAGGSVRGVVAGRLGYAYTGIDLRAEQVEANEEQLAAIAPGCAVRWVIGDSTDEATWEGVQLEQGLADLLFTCPPYFDLEVYSDDPADLSRSASYDDFLALLAAALGNATARIASERFAVVVMGEVRGKNGRQHGLPADTINVMRDLGWGLWNEAVYVTPAGSLPLRAGRIFSAARKLGRSHQAVLVFWNGGADVPEDVFGSAEAATTELA